MKRVVSALVGASACGAIAQAALQSVPMTDARVAWTGRTYIVNDSVAVDWEGSAARFAVSNATYVGLTIQDRSNGGARLAVYLDNTAMQDPNPSGAATPNLRVLTLVTSPYQSLYTLASGVSIVGASFIYRVVILTEPAFIGDVNASATLSFASIETDGIVVSLPTPPSPPRRMEVFGDSLTAGYGSGFDAPASGAACGASVMINDITNDYAWLLCSNFTAECAVEAVSGVTLMAGRPNLPEIANFTLGGMLRWPTGAQLWDYSRFAPDAVIINLGENDWHAVNNTPSPAFIAQFVSAYVGFVQSLDDAYRAPKNVTYFLTIGPHEAGQSVGVIAAAAQLSSMGISAHFLNASVEESAYPKGCGGHPGPSIHAAAAQRAQPIIASIMNW